MNIDRLIVDVQRRVGTIFLGAVVIIFDDIEEALIDLHDKSTIGGDTAYPGSVESQLHLILTN